MNVLQNFVFFPFVFNLASVRVGLKINNTKNRTQALSVQQKK